MLILSNEGVLEDGEPDSTFRILVATDNHLGYKERDPVRGADSFEVFEEILKLALSLNVDFVLHGGDLFDVPKPSRNTLYKTMRFLRTYCFWGEREPQFSIRNVATRPLVFKFGHASCERESTTVENYGISGRSRDGGWSTNHVSLPIFAIHGNHDDPGEEAFLSSLDLLEASTLVTYFGCIENLDDIKLVPLLLEKGSTKIALYGLGNIRDERLHRAFLSGKVQFCEPEFGSQTDYFNILVLHQNRFKGALGGLASKNNIREELLPKFLDLVIWGHEHDCVPTARESLQANFHVMQPGSSVATSLSSGEAARKHALHLEIRGESFRSTFIPLRAVRPLYIQEVVLREQNLTSCTEEAVYARLSQVVNEILRQSNDTWAEHLERWETALRQRVFPALGIATSTADAFISWAEQRQALAQSREPKPVGKTAPPLPLIRLRVEHTGFETFSAHRFGGEYVTRVANPDDLLLFYKGRKTLGLQNINVLEGPQAKHTGIPELEIADIKTTQGPDIQDLGHSAVDLGVWEKQIFTYLGDDPALELFPEPDMNIAVQNYVHKMETYAIDQFVAGTLRDAQQVAKYAERSVLAEPKSVLSADAIRTIVAKHTDSLRRARIETIQDTTPHNAAAPVEPITSPATSSAPFLEESGDITHRALQPPCLEENKNQGPPMHSDILGHHLAMRPSLPSTRSKRLATETNLGYQASTPLKKPHAEIADEEQYAFQEDKTITELSQLLGLPEEDFFPTQATTVPPTETSVCLTVHPNTEKGSTTGSSTVHREGFLFSSEPETPVPYIKHPEKVAHSALLSETKKRPTRRRRPAPSETNASCSPAEDAPVRGRGSRTRNPHKQANGPTKSRISSLLAHLRPSPTSHASDAKVAENNKRKYEERSLTLTSADKSPRHEDLLNRPRFPSQNGENSFKDPAAPVHDDDEDLFGLDILC